MVHRIAEDTILLARLRLFHKPVEVDDTAGKLVGLFVPAWRKSPTALLIEE